MEAAEVEGLAESLLSEVGLDDPPVDAFEVAAMCGLALRPSRVSGARLFAGVVEYDATARHERQHGLVAHEVAHWMLQRAGERDEEHLADYGAGALLLPRRAFERDLRRTWNVADLRKRHVNASAEMVARRVVALRDAVASIFDHGRLTARVASPWAVRMMPRVTPWERELAAEVLRTGEAVQGADLVWAVPVFDGAWRRVVVVAESRQLALRLSR